MESNENSLPIYVKFEDKGNIKNNSMYKILGTKIPNIIERNFNDFLLLREKLIERWPGMKIPNISTYHCGRFSNT